MYKDQIIIRVNTDKVTGTHQRQVGQAKTNNRKPVEKDDSTELLKKVATNFKLSHIEAYSNFFFQNNPAMANREYTIDNVDVKITDMREMVRFCRLVALKQLNETYDKYSKDLDELEFIDYCKKNNLDHKGEPLC